MIAVVALIIAIIVAGEIDHLKHLLGRAQDLPRGWRPPSESKISPFFGCASRSEWLADSWWRPPSINTSMSIADRLIA
jgi:hypothetical protein